MLGKPGATRLRIGAALVSGLIASACEPIVDLVLPPSGKAAPESDVVTVTDAEATRIYYQFTDGQGTVHFVESLEHVPERWRASVGFLESSTPPPISPDDMRRAMAADYRRLAARIGADSGNRGPRIILYGASWCGACRRAKAFLDGRGIRYEERNVDEPGPKRELVEKSGGRSIPVFDIEGRILKGFNPGRLEAMISEAS